MVTTKFKLNERVYSPAHGRGTVIDISSYPPDYNVYLVSFDNPNVDVSIHENWLHKLIQPSDLCKRGVSVAIHTPTYDEVKMLYSAFKSATCHQTDWNRYKEDTCFRVIEGRICGYASTQYYKETEAEIIESTDIDLKAWEVREKMKFKAGDIVIGNENACVYNVTKEGWIGTVEEADEYRMTVVDKNDGEKYRVSIDCFDLYTDKAIEQKTPSHRIRFETKEAERYVSKGKHKGETIPQVITFVYDDSLGSKGVACCDKANYDERQGVLEAIANMTFGNFDREYQRYKNQKKKIYESLCKCRTCGKMHKTPEVARECEKTHIERKKAKHERYLIRKEAKQRLANAEREGEIERIMKEIYAKEKQNAKRGQVR